MPDRPKFDWTKLLALLLLVAIVGYVIGRPQLEAWLGIQLPVVFEEERSATPNVSSPESNRDSDANPKSKSKSESSTRSVNKNSTGAEGDLWLFKKLTNGRLQSPAGLIYAMGPGGEHRVDHVLRHSRDEPTRNQSHGVFTGDREQILQLIDDAYGLIKMNSKQVSTSDEGDRVEYTIKFDRKIGYEGGRIGRDKNNPPVSRLRLVLENENYVVTAYPLR